MILMMAFLGGLLLQENSSSPQGEPVLEPPTLRSLGVYWILRGDANQNARIDVDYRKAGSSQWKKGPPLFRVARGPHKDRDGGSALTEQVPQDGWLFAGSLVLLDPDTAYEMRLRLSDPDGGATERLLQARTIAEPSLPPGMPEVHVLPGEGGGTGTATDPYKGLGAAEGHAKPGMIVLLHTGAYPGIFQVRKSGEPGKPIVWRGAGDGEVLIGGPAAGPRGIEAEGIHDVWFERLTVRNKDYGIIVQEAARIVIRHCHLQDVKNGINCSRNSRATVQGWWVSDNVLEGISPWPRPRGKMDENEWRGIQITGTGHEICYNRVHHFKDAIDAFPSAACAAIDVHNNDVSELNDDGFEMDYSERNVRNYYNRVVNAFCGISVQPVYGGPAYVFRNVLFNITNEPFKMHNSPSGVLLFHNTSVRKGMALQLFTPAKITNCVSRNNLFVGSAGPYAYENDAPMIDCSFDYDGFGGGPWKSFLRWNGARYATFEEMKAKAPVYRHATQVDVETLFAGGVRVPDDAGKAFDRAIDLRLKPGCSAIDAGEVLPGWNDGYSGKAPDLGAYELGQDIPPYGPRPVK